MKKVMYYIEYYDGMAMNDIVEDYRPNSTKVIIKGRKTYDYFLDNKRDIKNIINIMHVYAMANIILANNIQLKVKKMINGEEVIIVKKRWLC